VTSSRLLCSSALRGSARHGTEQTPLPLLRSVYSVARILAADYLAALCCVIQRWVDMSQYLIKRASLHRIWGSQSCDYVSLDQQRASWKSCVRPVTMTRLKMGDHECCNRRETIVLLRFEFSPVYQMAMLAIAGSKGRSAHCKRIHYAHKGHFQQNEYSDCQSLHSFKLLIRNKNVTIARKAKRHSLIPNVPYFTQA
jgi:hypothetical protein